MKNIFNIAIRQRKAYCIIAFKKYPPKGFLPKLPHLEKNSYRNSTTIQWSQVVKMRMTVIQVIRLTLCA